MKFRTVFYLLLWVLFISSGCATTEQASKPAKLDKVETIEKTLQKPALTLETTQETRTRDAKEKTPPPEILSSPAFKKAVPEKSLPLSKPIDPGRLVLAKGPVTINVERMPLPDFIIYALGETLKVSFVMDQKLMDSKEPITLRMTEAIPSDKALEIVLGLFEKYNLYMEEKAGALYIFQKSPEPKQPFDIRVGKEVAESTTQILQVVPLRHIRPVEIEALIKEFYKTGVQIKPYPKENVLLLYGQALQIKQIMEFIETFDVPYMQGKKVAILRLTYWLIDDFIKQITQIFEGLGITIAKAPKDPGILLIPIKPLGSILVVAPDDTSVNYVLEWKEKLDAPEAAGLEERPFVYDPRYSKASDLVKSIKNLYEIMPAPQPIPTAPGAPAAPSPARSPATPAVSKSGLRISADDNKNIIMVISSPAEYRNIMTLMRELDMPPRQVLIEATIAELTLKDDLKYGVEWYIKNRILGGSAGGAFTLESLFGLAESATSGLVFKFVTDAAKFSALINAFAAEDKVRILSTPRLMVLDNQEAMIQVGTDIPIITGEVTAADVTQAQPSILRNIQYRNTGIILRVKPTINTGGLLTLNISQEVSEVGTNPPGIDSPQILMRRINTSVVAAHGETIALGGLIAESKGDVENKIPLLGDIPLLGALFKTISKESRKVELLILLTPTILTNIEDTAKTTRELKKELKWFK